MVVLRYSQTISVSDGVNLVGADLLTYKFIEALKNRTVIGELGGTMLPGIVGDVAVPKGTSDNSVNWFGADNSDSISESTGITVLGNNVT